MRFFCILQIKWLNISVRAKISELLMESFMTLAFSFELIIWHAARSISASLSDHIYTARQQAHTLALAHESDGRRHVLLPHVAAGVRSSWWKDSA